jgi:two-component system cell cycle sensor histidine kinase/response regulator CckA
MASSRKHSLARSVLLYMIAGTVLVVLASGYTLISWELDHFEKVSQTLGEELLALQKARLKDAVDQAVDFIAHEQSKTEVRLKRRIKERTIEALQVADNIYRVNRPAKSKAEVNGMIKDALRPIRFSQGRGYYFAVSMDGVEQLYPVMPELEGQNLLHLRDARGTLVIQHEIDLVRLQGEGFLTDYWPKPDGEPGKAYPKISFVKYFAPLDWYIGTGEYLDDVEKDIQAEVLERIARIRLGRKGAVFAGRWDGISLLGPSAGQNIYDLCDPNGVKFIQELIIAARRGGGFVRYSGGGPNNRGTGPKISYAAGVPEWRWYVGAEVFLDEIDRLLALKKNELGAEMKVVVGKIVLVFFTLLLMITIVARFISIKTDKGLRTLVRFFDRAAKQSTRIDAEDLSFAEFVRLAEAANTMVDQRLKAEAAMRESRERWRAILDNANVGVYQVTLEGQWVFANPKMAQMLGYRSPEALLEQVPNVGQLYVDPEQRKENLDEFEREGAIDGKEVQFRRRDGQAIWLQASARVIAGKDGRRLVEGFLSDITERVLFQQALEESEARYRLLMEMLPEAVFVHRDGIIIYINRQGAELLGASGPDPLLGKPVLDFIHPDFRDAVRQRLTAIYSDTKMLVPMEQQYLRLDGRRIEVQATGTQILLAGETAGLSVIRDITDAKIAKLQKRKLERELQQAQKMEAIGTLAGGIAHDFNNLLMGIQGRTSLMLNDLEAYHPFREHLREIESYVKSATDLTKQLLGFARGGKYEVKPANMNAIVRQSSEMFRRTRKELRVHRKLLPALWPVEVDHSQMEQVLLNLYVNAWQAMAGSGELYLESENVLLAPAYAEPLGLTPGRYVKVTVTDTGRGMDADTRQRIFDPFFTTKKMGRGTGLGLASAYGIISNHGGIITVASEPGAGASFSILLPASEKPVSRNSPAASPIEKGSGTVLIVDDETIILEVGRQMLERLGYQVLTARSGAEGLDIFARRHRQIVLVILDLIMPEMGGGEVYDRLRLIDPDVRVLLSSGYSIDGQAEKILQRGCGGFVQKPFDLGVLSQAIQNIMAPESR